MTPSIRFEPTILIDDSIMSSCSHFYDVVGHLWFKNQMIINSDVVVVVVLVWF
ncbi:hypothetical protein Hanom_Chr05g00462201 [Helianthus anomalus]